MALDTSPNYEDSVQFLKDQVGMDTDFQNGTLMLQDNISKRQIDESSPSDKKEILITQQHRTRAGKRFESVSALMENNRAQKKYFSTECNYASDEKRGAKIRIRGVHESSFRAWQGFCMRRMPLRHYPER